MTPSTGYVPPDVSTDAALVAEVLRANDGRTYAPGMPLPWNLRLALRIRDLEAAIQQHHETVYATVRPVFSPPDVRLYEASGIRYNIPPAWHPTPDNAAEWRRDPSLAEREMAIAAERADRVGAGLAPFAANRAAADPVRVDAVPEGAGL
jgi:hypothetical protein